MCSREDFLAFGIIVLLPEVSLKFSATLPRSGVWILKDFHDRETHRIAWRFISGRPSHTKNHERLTSWRKIFVRNSLWWLWFIGRMRPQASFFSWHHFLL